MNIPLIKTDLPETPDEVIDIWLSTFFRRFGWPPRNDNDWRYVLRGSKDLAYLQSLQWEKKAIELRPDILHPEDLNIIIGLFSTHVLGQRTVFSSMSDGARRFNAAKDYLKENGVFPRAIVLGSSSQGYHVLDGSHRMTAFLYLYGFFNVQNEEVPCLNVKQLQEVWIGSPKA